MGVAPIEVEGDLVGAVKWDDTNDVQIDIKFVGPLCPGAETQVVVRSNSA
jgi:hypothetical protein